MQYIAVIDCGTNTFTMSLFEVKEDQSFRRLLKDRHYVELAEESIKYIGKAPFQRGLAAFKGFEEVLKDYPDCMVYPIGTAALRRAANSKEFLAAVDQQSQMTIDIIDGDREAALIHQGVRLAAPLDEEPSLIMDIGGGSVEFILCSKDEVFWAKSFPVGVAVLFQAFHKSDPIQKEELDAIKSYLDKELKVLLEQLEKYPPKHLIGASGSFDVLDKLVGAKLKGELYGKLTPDQFWAIHEELTKASYEERLNTKNIMPTRAKLIVMSMALISFTLKHIDIPELIVSDYALREGLVWELLQK
ncbi:MAG: hypothetical protein GY810_06400 [Aureispira sp.]|nr:hypothetical protein [Aureispira sp.]